jgi:hypothetical protein
MLLEINPRVEGKLVERVMASQQVKDILDTLPEGTDMHGLVKTIIISAFSKFEFNFAHELKKQKDYLLAQPVEKRSPCQ